MKSDKLLKELKVKRKVTYDEYVAYLKGKSEIPHQEPKAKNEEIIIENNEPEEEL